MKRLLTTTLFAGLCLGLVLPGCVSSRKYKESQSSLNLSRQSVEQLRADSIRLATETAARAQQISALEYERTSMKSSLDSLNNYISQQRPNMDYQAYFSGQELSGTQLQQSLSASLASSGITGDNIEHRYGIVAVSMDESKYFSGTNLNTSGKKVLKEIAGAIKDQKEYKVGVSPVSPFGSADSSNMAMNEDVNTDAANPSTSDVNNGVESRGNSSLSDRSGKKATAGKKTSSSTARKYTAARKTSIARKYSSESGKTVYNKPRVRKSTATPMSVRSARATNVAKNLLQNGVDEVNVTLKNTKTASGVIRQKETIRIVLSPDNSKMFSQKPIAVASQSSGQE